MDALATWALSVVTLVDMTNGRLGETKISAFGMEEQLLNDFAEYYRCTDVFRRLQQILVTSPGPAANDPSETLFRTQTTCTRSRPRRRPIFATKFFRAFGPTPKIKSGS